MRRYEQQYCALRARVGPEGLGDIERLAEMRAPLDDGLGENSLVSL